MATRLIIGVNVAVFVLMVFSGVSWLSPSPGQLVNWGADFGPYTVDGQWWRTVTSMFLHIGIIHLGFNMYALYGIGVLVERLFGRFGFAVLYLVSGVGGDLASLWRHPIVAGAGASGAIFGLVGGLIAFLVLQRHTLPAATLKSLSSNVGSLLLFNLVFGATVPGIDMSAHIGGLVSGFVVGLMLSVPLKEVTPRQRALRGMVAVAAGAIAMLVCAPRITAGVREAAKSLEAEVVVGGALEGKLTDAAGAGIGSATVTAIDREKQTQSVTTAGDGSYRFDELPLGPYVVVFSANGAQEMGPPIRVERRRTTPLDHQMAAGRGGR